MLRSMRYGEADRILHLYTPHRGRVGAIAKGVRRARSRFGGRLEPFFRLRPRPARGPQRPADGHGAETVDGLSRACASDGRRARRRRARLRRGRRGCSTPPSRIPAVFHLLCNELALLDADPARAGARQPARLPPQAAARRRPRAAARGVRLVRRARAPQRLLGRRRRRRVPRLRGVGSSRSTRRRTRSWSTRSAGRWPRRRARRRARAAPGRARDRRDARAPRGRPLAPRPSPGRIAAMDGGDEVGLRLLRGLARHARPARRQGRQRRGDDAHPRRRAGAGAASRSRPRRASPTCATDGFPDGLDDAGRRGAGARWRSAPASGSATPTTRCSSRCARARASRCRACSTPS